MVLSGTEHLWQVVDAAGLLLAAWVWYQMFVAALAVSLPFQSKRTSTEDLSGAEAAVQHLSELMHQYYEASCQMFGSRSGEDAADLGTQLDRSIGDASEESQQDEGCHICQKTRETTSSGSIHGMSSEDDLKTQEVSAADAARDEKEIHEVDPPVEVDPPDDEQDDERDDAKTNREDDPHENVDTVEQANIASEYGADAHSKGDMKHELDEEKENLDVDGNPEEETARELVELVDDSNDPKESEIVEAKEDPDAPHTDSTEHPSEDPVERSSPSHRCDFDISDLERMSISPRGSLGPEQQRVQKVQRDHGILPDPESKDWRPSLFRAAKSQARVKTRHSGTSSSRQGYSFYTTHERPR